VPQLRLHGAGYVRHLHHKTSETCGFGASIRFHTGLPTPTE
jgi:hypothetical protein